MISRQLLIIGASGHGKVVADLAEKNGYLHIAFLDDDLSKKQIGKYKVIGPSSLAEQNPESDFIVAIGNASVREQMQRYLLSKNLNIVSLVHPQAVVANDVSIGTGSVVMAGAVINSSAVLGQGVIVNTSSSVDHDCTIGDFSHVAVGSHIAGTCHIGSKTWIGAGATISNNVNVTDGCVIGAGAVVIRNLNLAGTYVGVPVRMLDKSHKQN